MFENLTVADAFGLENSTEVGLAIPTCHNSYGRIPAFSYSLAAVNFFAIPINVGHILVLSRMSSLRGTAYYYVLLHISLGDIFSGFGSGTRLSINHAEYFRDVPLAGFIVYNVVMDSMIIGRYSIMAAASLERYYAMCKPLQYATSRYIRKLNLWLCLIWVGSFLLTLIRDSVFRSSMCFNHRLGPSNTSGAGPGLIVILGMLIPAAVTAILLIRVSVELYRMRKRSVNREEEQVKRGTQYLIIIIVIFYLCFLPPFVEYALFILGSYSLARFYINMILFSSLYGHLNTVIYGWVTPSYRKRVWAMVTCNSRFVSSSMKISRSNGSSSTSGNTATNGNIATIESPSL